MKTSGWKTSAQILRKRIDFFFYQQQKNILFIKKCDLEYKKGREQVTHHARYKNNAKITKPRLHTWPSSV